jgi:hypothetical protein
VRIRLIASLRFLLAVTLLALVFAPTAKATEAQWSFSPTSWNFGEVIPGTGPTPPKAFVLTNTGEVDLQPALISIGSEEGEFKFAGNTCKGSKLAPGAKCEIGVTFNPSTPGPKEGELEVQSQAGLATPAGAELSGYGAGPIVSITPEALNFGQVVVGEVSAPKTFTVRNDGPLTLAISSLEIPTGEGPEGPLPIEFHIAGGTCKAGGTVPPGASCTVDVIFAPTVVQGISTFVKIVDNAFDSPHSAYLSGMSLKEAPWSYISPYGHNLRARVFIRKHPPHRTSARSAVFGLRGSWNASRFVCKLDQGPLKACGDSISYRGLSVGSHHFEARAFNASGDIHPGRPTIYRWRIRRQRH